ncbi:hypothetical protein MAMC_00617 [Methylacidimicrobium cyclopophantes]|uniref:Uncharacterized protein n=1 Tax=Methylacidimicrobium cyclopophantes TaxID=1041766 RepID=A0A5E6MHJ7_9BACT|nr:hypothetical protein MAMC_00617 [Methylacidimicrobium cyclopophantes]
MGVSGFLLDLMVEVLGRLAQRRVLPTDFVCEVADGVGFSAQYLLVFLDCRSILSKAPAVIPKPLPLFRVKSSVSLGTEKVFFVLLVERKELFTAALEDVQMPASLSDNGEGGGVISPRFFAKRAHGPLRMAEEMGAMA